MLLTVLAQRLRSQFDKPFISYELRWATDVPGWILEEQLDDAYERVENADSKPVWHHKNWLLPDDRLRMTDEEDIQVYRQIKWWIKPILFALILFSPLLVTSIWSVGLYLPLSILFSSSEYNKKPVPGATEIITERSNGGDGILGLLAIITAFIFLFRFTDHLIVLILCVIVVGIFITRLYLSDALPFVAPDTAKRPMEIPFGILVESIGATILFFSVVFFSAFIDQFGSALGSYAEQVERTGATILGLPGDSTTSEAVWQATVEALSPVLWTALAVSGIVLILWITESRRYLKQYYRYRLRAFSSSVQRAVALLFFATFTVFVYSIVAIAGGIILYGITGVYYPPAWTLEPLLEQFPFELQTSIDDILPALYRTLDYVFADAPVLHVRSWSLAHPCSVKRRNRQTALC